MGDVIHMHEPRDLLLDDARTKNIVFLKLQNTLVLLVRLYDAGSSKRRDGSSRRKNSKRVTLLPNLVKVILVHMRKKERKEERKKD
jgi:hypothetical protein